MTKVKIGGDGVENMTVYKLPYTNPGNNKLPPETYHKSRQCISIDHRKDEIETTLGEAEDDGLRPCGRCFSKSPFSGKPSRPCPLCNAQDVHLPAHLPECPKG